MTQQEKADLLWLKVIESRLLEHLLYPRTENESYTIIQQLLLVVEHIVRLESDK